MEFIFFSHFGNTYQHPVYVKDTDKAVNILAGLPEIKTLEKTNLI